MKNLLFFLLFSYGAFGQLPYTWTTGIDPLWVSDGNGLQWQSSCNYVTTNCGGNYSNNMTTSYTSSLIEASCFNASTISITFTAFGNTEFQYDFMFIEYSLNNGVTWINPYGSDIGWTGNFGAFPGITIPPIILSTANNIRFRFRFTSDSSVKSSGLKISGFNINCNPALPIELLSFIGFNQTKENVLEWETSSENNNNFFTLERSEDGLNWQIINITNGAGNSINNIKYNYIDFEYNNVINYYRLSQTDYDGHSEAFNTVIINNNIAKKEILKIVNTLGQEVNENTKGIVFIIYLDGEIERIWNN